MFAILFALERLPCLCYAGTGSDWSTEELDFDKELDNTTKIDWSEDVERELALQVCISIVSKALYVTNKFKLFWVTHYSMCHVQSSEALVNFTNKKSS